MNTMQQLVEQYIPFANKLASQKKRNLPKFIDIEELKSAAYMGLVEAASRYNPDLGVKFTTFSYPRIFGAIHDYLREQGWMKREHAVLSLDARCADSEDCVLRDTIEAKVESDVEDCFEVITLNLDDHAKKILHTYFIDEYSMKEVGDRFGVSESRISQLIKSYKNSIKESWDERELRTQLAA
jgi:RNA polymerase sigma factor for flagellar operon FliA